MPENIRRTLEELVELPSSKLPPLCNVYVRIASMPVSVSQDDRYGPRWRLEVVGLSSKGKAFVAIHRDPQRSGLGLPYSATDPSLLRMFDEEKLQGVVRPGETALIQAVPKHGEGGLWLNVPAIFILRPFRRFGRREVNFASHCQRKTYLTAIKAVSYDSTSDFHPGTVSGHIADDLLGLAVSSSGLRPGNDDTILAALSATTVARLVILGLGRASADTHRALDRGAKALETLRGSPSVRDLLSRDRWQTASGALSNAVNVEPDLLGDRHVVEMKFVDPASQVFNRAKFRRQLQDYLAWAKVEYGSAVGREFSGALLCLHPAVPEHERVDWVAAGDFSIATRILNRHRLLALVRSAWLPRPEPNCQDCADCPYALPGAEGLPAPCMFHCQAERGWDCWSAEPLERCPLFSRCDQFKEHHDFERVDEFNRLRQALLHEEEERTVIRQLIEACIESSAARDCGMILEGFQVESFDKSRLTLVASPELAALEFATLGTMFQALAPEGSSAVLVYSKRKVSKHRDGAQGGERLLFRTIGRFTASLAWADRLQLRPMVQRAESAKEQLSSLELAQRAGQMPFSLRQGAWCSKTAEVRETSLDAILPDDGLILIDLPQRHTEAAVLRKLISTARNRMLVVKPNTASLEDVDIFDLCEDELADAFERASGPARDRLDALLRRAEEHKVWALSRSHLSGGYLEKLAKLEFSEIVCLDAATMPMSLLGTCLDLLVDRAPGALTGRTLRGPVILMGQAASAGPIYQSANARGSRLSQNTLKLLMDSERTPNRMLPDGVGVQIVRVAPRGGCRQILDRFGLHALEAEETGRLEFHLVAGTTSGMDQVPDLSLSVSIPMVEGQDQRRILSLEVEDPNLSFRGLELVLRGVSAHALGNLTAIANGRIDSTVLGYRCRVVDVSLEPALLPQYRFHSLTVKMPARRFPFIQEHLYTNGAEAHALVEFARNRPATSFHGTSPFFSQCVLLSRLINEMSVSNLRVLAPRTLGRRIPSAGTSMLVSCVLDDVSGGLPFPMSGTRMLDFFTGRYEGFHVFCSAVVKQHHPLLRDQVNA